MPVVTLAWGVLAFIAMVVALLPCLRALNWMIAPFAAVGIVLSIVALVSPRWRKEPGPIAGLVCNVIAAVISWLRIRGGFGV